MKRLKFLISFRTEENCYQKQNASPPVAGIALEMMVRAIQDKSQDPERTTVDLSSCPSIEMLAGRAANSIQAAV